MTPERKSPDARPEGLTAVAPRPRLAYAPPRIRSANLYERAKLACVFNELDEEWEGSTS